MDIEYIIIFAIFLFSLSCVSASEDVVSDINVTFDDVMWQENLSDIDVELPQKAEGNFSLKINDEVIYNEVITNKSFKIPIKLPKDSSNLVVNMYPPCDYKKYKVSAFYNDINLNITDSLKIMKYSPDISNFLNFPNEILQHSQTPCHVLFPRSAKGDVEIYVDDNFLNKTKVSSPFFIIENGISNLKLGRHNLTVSYLGDSYYLPFNKTFNFNLTNALIRIPQTVNIGHDDCVSVDVLKNTTGMVRVYLDSKLIHEEYISDGEFILSLEDYLKYNSSNVGITFTNNDFTKSLIQKINITYDFDVFPQSFIYGENNALEITLPETFNNKLFTTTIDGVKYNFTHSTYIMNNIIEIDISKLDSGNHTIFMSFDGDDKFTAKNKTSYFTIDYSIQSPFMVDYMDGSCVFLKLPKNADGNLTLYVNNQLFNSVKLKNGYAEIKIDKLEPGKYDITATYDGSDYNVSSLNDSIIVEAKISVDYFFTAGEDKYITVNVPSNCSAYVIINNQKIVIKNGLAKYSLKNFKSGEHEIYIDYYGANGFNSTDMYYVITVYKHKINVISAKLYTTGINTKIKILNHKNKAMSNVNVVLSIGGKTFSCKSDKNGFVTLKKSLKLKNKKYKLSISAGEAKVSLNLKAQKALTLEKINIKKSKKSILLIAKLKFNVNSLKGKKIKFIINGVKFTKKTNKYGVAKININKNILSKFIFGQKIKYQVIYQKTVIKRSITLK